MLKHAIDVDKDTRRVIIITPNRDDHSSEHDNYFLVVKPKGGKHGQFLKDQLRILKNLI
jgi:hypothetical protein